MVMLDDDKLRRATFFDKKKVYLHAPYILAKKVAEYEEWNLNSVNNYQEWMASQAINTWKVDYE